jgi:hypothetical protein
MNLHSPSTSALDCGHGYPKATASKRGKSAPQEAVALSPHCAALSVTLRFLLNFFSKAQKKLNKNKQKAQIAPRKPACHDLGVFVGFPARPPYEATRYAFL